jgi:hypothetical protein
MSAMGLERQIDTLSEALDDAETDEERADIEAEIRDIDRELAERDCWEEEGDERGWW